MRRSRRAFVIRRGFGSFSAEAAVGSPLVVGAGGIFLFAAIAHSSHIADRVGSRSSLLISHSTSDRLQRDGELTPGGQGDTAVEDAVIASGDLVEQGAVDADDRPEHGPTDGIDQRDEPAGVLII